MIRSKLNLLKLTGVLLFLAVWPVSTRAQWMSQTNILVNGWNAVYLNLDASHDTIDNLVWKNAANPIQDIWMWDPDTGTAQFLTDPSSPLTSSLQWQQWARSNVNIVTNRLNRLLGNKAYLVRSTNTANYSWVVTGKPVPPSYQWTSSGENFVGFPVNPAKSSTFSDYLAAAPLFVSTAQIFRYVGGNLTESNPVLVDNPSTVNIQRGQAYWVRSPDFNNYYGPFTVSGGASGIAFGTTLGQSRITLANNTSKDLTLYLNLLGSATPPTNQPVVSGVPPILIRGGLNITNLTHGYTVLNGLGNFPVLLKPSGQPGSSMEVILGLNRAALTNYAAGSLLAGVLRITDAGLLEEINLPVTATVASSEGLWVGTATVNAVDQYLNNYYTAVNLIDLTNQLRNLGLLTNTIAQGTGLKGEYWETNKTPFDTTSPTLTRVDSTINLAGTTAAPATAIGSTDYWVRWTGFVQAKDKSASNEVYSIIVEADDKIKLTLNGLVLIDATNTTSKAYTNTLTMVPGEFYGLQIEYRQGAGSATCKLFWESFTKSTNATGVVSTTVKTAKQLIPTTQLYNSVDKFVGYKNGNTYNIDPASGRIMELTGKSGAFLSTAKTVPNGSVPVGFDLRLIVHAGTNAAAGRQTMTLLQHIYTGSGVNGPQVITTTTNLLDRTKLASARRISSTHFPWKGDDENVGWASRSNLLSPVAIFDVELDYNDQAANPFVHAYHPDHDNLDANFLPTGNGKESFKIIRNITLTTLPPEDTFQSLTLAAGKRQGHYREQIKITDDGVKTRIFDVEGRFSLNQISENPVLLNAGKSTLTLNIGADPNVRTLARKTTLESLTNGAAPIQSLVGQ